jgi:Rrf2 family transcriptional regulator, iron-sulfur cluster assembly transcription factor
MNLLSRRSILAIAAVVDVALYARPTPVTAKSLAARHYLPPRHLETLLQGLVQANVLKGVRGPRGGYELARGRSETTAGEIVRTALAMSAADPSGIGGSSSLLKKLIEPRIRKAGDGFLAHLDRITVEDLCVDALDKGILEDDPESDPRGEGVSSA